MFKNVEPATSDEGRERGDAPLLGEVRDFPQVLYSFSEFLRVAYGLVQESILHVSHPSPTDALAAQHNYQYYSRCESIQVFILAHDKYARV